MTNNAILIIILGSLAFWSTTASSQSVYKWVDDNGVVHFGAQPPAVNSGGEEDKVELIDEDSRKSRLERLAGSWWGRSPDGATINLRFYPGGEFWHEEHRPDSRQFRTRVKGRYQLSNDALTLDYGNSNRYEARFNEPQEYIVSRLDDQTLKLTRQGQQLSLKRLQPTRVTPLSSDLYGKWFNTENRTRIYEFGHGRFKLLTHNGPRRYKTRAEGNWHWQDPVMSLEVIVDYTRERYYTGDTYEWRILDRRPESITLRRTSDGREIKLQRLDAL
ncbi:DUF4124 domain-containing protein [Marinobacter oulmenensis]|uniref:DUF4124 domain-containing protein n=1 Tax=Marinobacter oulmenensis TaxID=643747 RepID=A0A840UG35_9GAMM|nr:hypothetical protein [Marinobacter oulmenensis]